MSKYPKLINVLPLDNYKLLLTFSNEEERVYDFIPNLNHKFFKDLKDPVLFSNVHVIDGEIEWQTGQDFCPHTLYEKSEKYSG